MTKQYLMGEKIQVTPIYESSTSILASKDIQKKEGKTFSGYFMVTRTGLKYKGVIQVGDKITLDSYYTSIFKNYIDEETGLPREGTSLVVKESEIDILETTREIKKDQDLV